MRALELISRLCNLTLFLGVKYAIIRVLLLKRNACTYFNDCFQLCFTWLLETYFPARARSNLQIMRSLFCSESSDVTLLIQMNAYVSFWQGAYFFLLCAIIRTQPPAVAHT